MQRHKAEILVCALHRVHYQVELGMDIHSKKIIEWGAGRPALQQFPFKYGGDYADGTGTQVFNCNHFNSG
jgi:hypothetical protein